MSTERCLLLTDPLNFPENPTFYGLLHHLLRQIAHGSPQENDFSLAFATPQEAIEQIEDISVILDRTLCYTPQVKALHRKCAERNIPYVNHPTLMALLANKKATHDALSLSGIKQPFTQSIGSKDDLIKFMSRLGISRRFVIKPTWGGMGDWVTFVEMTHGGYIRARWKEDSLKIKEFCGFPSDFCQQVLFIQIGETNGGSRSAEGPVSWIAQEYLDLTGIDGLARDIRVIQQRDRFGVMKTSLIHGRQSDSAALPLTNLSKGGQLCSVEQILDGTGITIDQLLSLCSQVNHVFETATGHNIGEIGHDIAVTRSADKFHLIYLEGNTMPGYVLESWDLLVSADTEAQQPVLTTQDRTLLVRPFEYANRIRKNY